MEHNMPHTIESIVEEIKEETVKLKTKNSQTLDWPRKLLPDNLEVGATIHLIAFAHEDAEKERKRLAQYVLNEMLKSE